MYSRRCAAAQGERIVHIPLDALSPTTLEKVRVVHLLASRSQRAIARQYVRQANDTAGSGEASHAHFGEPQRLTAGRSSKRTAGRRGSSLWFALSPDEGRDR